MSNRVCHRYISTEEALQRTQDLMRSSRTENDVAADALRQIEGPWSDVGTEEATEEKRQREEACKTLIDFVETRAVIREVRNVNRQETEGGSSGVQMTNNRSEEQKRAKDEEDEIESRYGVIMRLEETVRVYRLGPEETQQDMCNRDRRMRDGSLYTEI